MQQKGAQMQADHKSSIRSQCFSKGLPPYPENQLYHISARDLNAWGQPYTLPKTSNILTNITAVVPQIT